MKSFYWKRVRCSGQCHDEGANGRWILFRKFGTWIFHYFSGLRNRISEEAWLGVNFSPDTIVISRGQDIFNFGPAFSKSLQGICILQKPAGYFQTDLMCESKSVNDVWSTFRCAWKRIAEKELDVWVHGHNHTHKGCVCAQKCSAFLLLFVAVVVCSFYFQGQKFIPNCAKQISWS